VAQVTARGGEPPTVRAIDPRAVRVALAGSSVVADLAPIVVEPSSATASNADGTIFVDGAPCVARLDRVDPVHAVLAVGHDPGERTRLLLLPADGAPDRPVHAAGGARLEVVVDGWRIELEVDSERRADLRERARRGREVAGRDGPTEVHAMIPGVVVSVSVVPGDAVAAGQQLLVVEAMKMQNEVRAPRDGVVGRVAVGARRTIEVGDLLLVLE
jgi:biotin carboxyl carrier protein